MKSDSNLPIFIMIYTRSDDFGVVSKPLLFRKTIPNVENIPRISGHIT
jgi:hypothetical protein